MRKPILCLVAIALALNLPLGACAPPATPTRTPTPRPIETPTPQPVETPAKVPSPISQTVSASQPATLAFEDGFTVDIPRNGVYQDDTVTIKVVEEAPSVEIAEIVIPGTVYEVDLEGAEFFRQPVSITIPYDPTLLPEGRSEAEIFAVFWYEGGWHRLYGEVDEINNTVTVLTLHNDFWSWAVSLVDNLDRLLWEKGFWFTEMGTPENVEETRKVVEYLEDMYDKQWDLLLERIDHIEFIQSPSEVAEQIKAGAFATVVSAQLNTIATMIAGSVGTGLMSAAETKVWFYLIAASGHTVAMISAIGGTAYLGAWGLAWIDGLEMRLEMEYTYKRLQEARCLLFAFEHPEIRSVDPLCENFLKNYVEALTEEQLEHLAFDPDFTAIPPVETPPGTVSSQYFPVAVGNYWVWRVTEFDGTTWEYRNEIVETQKKKG